MTVASTLVRIVVILLAVAGTFGQLAYLDALWWHAFGLTAPMARHVGSATVLLLAAHAVVALVCSVLAVLLALHEGRRGGAALALALAFGSWSYLMAYSGVTMLLRPITPGFGREVFEAHFLVVEVVGLCALVRFTAIFPRALTEEELAPSPTLPALFRPVHRTAVVMRGPAAPWIAGGLVIVALWGWTLASGGELSDAGLSPLMDVVRLAGAGLVVMNLHRAWRMSTEGDLDALMWLAFALTVLIGSLALLIGGNVLVAVTGFPEPDVAWRPMVIDGGTIGFFLGLALSVLGGGRDPAAMTRKVATLTLVGTSGLFLAAGLEALFTGVVFSSYATRVGVGTALAFAIVLSTYRTSANVIERVLPL